MNFISRISGFSLLLLLCGLLYFPFLGEVQLFDWDETMIASVSKEMFSRNEILQPWLDGKFFLECPPFFFWLQLLSYKYLGINEYAARFPNALCAVLVVLTLYRNGQRMFSTNFGMLWAIVYMSMLLPQIFHRSGIAEIWFCFFVYLSLYNMSRVIEARQEKSEKFYKRRDVFSNLFYSAFAATGAILTKGVEGYFIVLLTYWFVFLFSSAKYGFGYGNILRWTVYVVLMVAVWVAIEYKWHGWMYLKPFFNYQWSELNLNEATGFNRASFQFIILFLGCFPASALAFNSFQIQTYESRIQKIFRLMMVGCLVIVLIITTFFKTKMAAYSILAYYPISFLAAYSINYILIEKKSISKLSYFLLVIGGLIWTISLVLIPLTQANLDVLKEHIHEVTLQQALSQDYSWQTIEVAFGALYFAVILLTFVMFFFKKHRAGLAILFFGFMFASNLVLLYYLPKIEQITQGAPVNFIKNNQQEQAYYYHLGSKSYIPKFYSDNALIFPAYHTLEDYTQYNTQKISKYLTLKTVDTALILPYQNHWQLLYQQGIYSFYKYK